MLVNPNRPDLFGKYISTNEEDGDGKKFREEFLENIKKYGESYTKYSYKKPDSKELKYKLSYFKYYPNFNWIIAAGVYIDDIENELKIKKDELKEEIRKQILQNIILFLIFLIIAIFTLALISNKIYKILKNYKQKVVENEKELKILNKSLEEMISNIAHQWRQPLTELSSILMFIKLKFDTKTLDTKIMENKIEDATQVLEYMSHTIDDFRGFFSPTKEKERFYLYELIENILLISSNMFKNNNIEIVCDIDKNLILNNYLNELQQVVLNILKNAKDALVENNIKDPYIKIEAKLDEKNIYLSITDNAGGITTEPINKIFEAYFTTKDQSKGMGIGLYMSKMILEKSMKGKLFVENLEDKARFTIKL
jgi:signal transduction histidine kinase